MKQNHWTLIDQATGAVVMTGFGGEPPVMDGTFAIDEAADVDQGIYDLETGKLKTRPPRPSISHDWDYAAKQWVVNPGRVEKAARARVKALLSESDWTQIDDAPQGKKGAWRQYRQALRNLSKQPGWPDDVTWPEPPDAGDG